MPLCLRLRTAMIFRHCKHTYLFCNGKEKAGNICVNVNYKLPLPHESKKRHSI